MTAATDWSDRDIERVQQDVAQQKKLVRRMIVRGAPSQAAEDTLLRMERMLDHMKEQRELTSAPKGLSKNAP
jgi:hypothetical protein